MFDETETIDGNPKSWAAWKREAERLQKIIDEMTTNHPAHGPVSLERLHQIREHLQHDTQYSNGGSRAYILADVLKVIDVAITSFDAEPVAIVPVMYKGVELLKKDGLELIRDGMAEATELESMCMAKALLSAQPAPVVPEWTNEECLEFLSIAFRHAEIKGDLELDDIRLGIKMVNESRAAMLQAGNFREITNSSTNNCREIAETSTNEHEIETHTLLKSIEGMEVSVDVSTCDADAGHRYFGTVTEISELDTAKNGYILLVQDAKPNFNLAVNSPVTPDGWQLVPKEPTEAMNKAGWAAINEHDAINPTYRAMLAAAPQQDVRLALEIGMSRYAGAMQKLVDSGD